MPTDPTQDAASEWQGQDAIRAAIGTAGAAVWIQQGQDAARGACYGLSTPEEAICALGALRHATNRIADGLAVRFGIDAAVIREMSRDVERALADTEDSAIRIKPAKAGGGHG